MKIYAIYDKSSQSLYNNWIRPTADVRELYTAYKNLVNDKDKGGVLAEFPEDFQIVYVGDIEGDHLEAPIDNNGKITNFVVVKELRDLVEPN